MKKIIIAIIVILVIGLGFYFINKNSDNTVVTENQEQTTESQTEQPDENQEKEPVEISDQRQVIIGQSIEDRNIIAYQFGTGDTELLFVGGIHGGYSWNTALVAYELINYLETNMEEVIPDNIQVTVVPALNPDGLSMVVDDYTNFSSADISGSTETKTSARFNANDVDLNRNFDCDWQSVGKWQDRDVDGGDSAFSEPESQAIKNYIESNDPSAVVVWYSSAGGVFASSCHNGVLDETNEITNAYADASGYKAYQEFDFYTITGDMVNWLAKEGVPAISVLLTDHSGTEWSKNREGVEALLEYYAEEVDE